MDKSSRTDIPLEAQREMWNRWNAQHRERSQGEVSRRQAAVVEQWLEALGRTDLKLIDIGCGAGWMCERLLRFGFVTGTDLADDVLVRARERTPEAEFLAGDFMQLALHAASYDVAVSLEVLSHIPDQPAFIERIAQLLRPGGLLLLATQNRRILERSSDIGMPLPGQIRRWVDARELRRLLQPSFEILEMTSLFPRGDQGLLRLVNSMKVNRVLDLVASREFIENAKERLLLGHTLMVRARRRETKDR
jgi:2-polyprenyl-3-methyl-5-hydroxy-6-metoxy-1,4-benzoquinol methylase